MLELTIESKELYNEKTNDFINLPTTKLQLEHSLISVYKWESKWHIPFLGKEKTIPEILDYIRCMTITKNVDLRIYDFIPKAQLVEIIDYINDPMTATKINDDGLIGAQKNKNETVTAELIYYWMITLNVPVEFEKWHLNKLLSLIKVINFKNTPPKKIGKKEAAMQRAQLNAQRRAMYHSKG